jgi:cell division protein ZapA (FtsZ GTPase activity inhibitor)
MTTQIKVTIAGRNYPLRVQHEEEKERIQEAVDLINQKVLDFKATYAGKDTQDYLAMVAMSLTVEWISYKEKGQQDLKGLAERLDEIGELLSS